MSKQAILITPGRIQVARTDFDLRNALTRFDKSLDTDEPNLPPVLKSGIIDPFVPISGATIFYPFALDYFPVVKTYVSLRVGASERYYPQASANWNASNSVWKYGSLYGVQIFRNRFIARACTQNEMTAGPNQYPGYGAAQSDSYVLKYFVLAIPIMKGV